MIPQPETALSWAHLTVALRHVAEARTAMPWDGQRRHLRPISAELDALVDALDAAILKTDPRREP